MIRLSLNSGLTFAAAGLLCCSGYAGYRNFRVAVYARAYEVKEMAAPGWLASRWAELETQVHVDKVYLETHRDLLVVDHETLETARRFFAAKGIETAGGITLTVNERNRFETFCYANPEHRRKVQEIVEYTARHFDEVILDDFFFTNCKCELCIEAKGDSSWTDFRLRLMTGAARELVMEPARRVNPRVRVIIKYPNWYEHFQGLGFNLETEPRIFDGLYTGTETRDAVFSNQHLQPYLGYLIFRFFEHLKPGANLGGWVDTGGLRHLDRYAEQLWLTLFAKAPEITLFDLRQLQRPLRPSDRAPWQGTGTSFDFDRMMEPFRLPDGREVKPTTIARAAGYALESVDGLLGRLGRPIGIHCYKPFHSVGEDYLPTYLGGIGIPLDLVPEFPAGGGPVLLTEAAATDALIAEKIGEALRQGRRVTITSGLLRALQGKGIEEVVELRYTDRKAAVRDFPVGWGRIVSVDRDIIIPQVHYLTNDSWEEVSALAGPNGFPLLHSAVYGRGTLYVLTIPENFADLYRLPREVLGRIGRFLAADLPVRLEAPGEISLLLYDNDTFIVESFRDDSAAVEVVIQRNGPRVTDLISGEVLAVQPRPVSPWERPGPDQSTFSFELGPHSYRAFGITAAPAAPAGQ